MFKKFTILNRYKIMNFLCNIKYQNRMYETINGKHNNKI